MAVQTSGSVRRNDVTASTSFGGPIPVAAGSNRRLLLGCVAGRFTIEDQGTPTYDGVAMTLVGGTTTDIGERVRWWEMVDPPVGTADWEVTNPGNTNDGAWFWIVLDESTGTATGQPLEELAVTTATPAATVGAGQIGVVAGGSVSYAGGGALGGTTQIGGTHDGRCAGYRIGAAPGLGTWGSNQTAAYTVVVSMGGGGTSATANGSTVTAAASLIAGGASAASGATANGVTLSAAASLLYAGGTLQFQAAGMEFGARTGLGIDTFALDAAANYRYTVHADGLVLGSALITSGVVATDSGGKLPNLVNSLIAPGVLYRVHAIRQADGEAATFRMKALA